MNLLKENHIKPNQAFVTFMNKKDRDLALKCAKKFNIIDFDAVLL